MNLFYKIYCGFYYHFDVLPRRVKMPSRIPATGLMTVLFFLITFIIDSSINHYLYKTNELILPVWFYSIFVIGLFFGLDRIFNKTGKLDRKMTEFNSYSISIKKKWRYISVTFFFGTMLILYLLTLYFHGML